jgi:hypothetical protein
MISGVTNKQKNQTKTQNTKTKTKNKTNREIFFFSPRGFWALARTEHFNFARRFLLDEFPKGTRPSRLVCADSMVSKGLSALVIGCVVGKGRQRKNHSPKEGRQARSRRCCQGLEVQARAPLLRSEAPIPCWSNFRNLSVSVFDSLCDTCGLLNIFVCLLPFGNFFLLRSSGSWLGRDARPRGIDLSRYVKWPLYVRLQRQRAILKQRLKVAYLS